MNKVENKKTKEMPEIEPVRIINMETGEIFLTNERDAFSDFEYITKKYGNSCSLFFSAGNTGR